MQKKNSKCKKTKDKHNWEGGKGICKSLIMPTKLYISETSNSQAFGDLVITEWEK